MFPVAAHTTVVPIVRAVRATPDALVEGLGLVDEDILTVCFDPE
jgi:hypothetical protein